VSNVGNTCEMVNCNVLNDVSKCYNVAEMDEINIISYHIIHYFVREFYDETTVKILLKVQRGKHIVISINAWYEQTA
jgi:hypothetical protein